MKLVVERKGKFAEEPAASTEDATVDRGKRKPRLGQRHVLILLTFFGIFNIYTMRSNISVAIVAMVGDSQEGLLQSDAANHSSGERCDPPYPSMRSNDTANLSMKELEAPRTFDWDPETQGIILGSYFYGYTVTQLLGGWTATRFGGKYPFGIGILLCAILTLLTPLAAKFHYGAMIAFRVLEGLATGLCYPAMQNILSRWSPEMERTIMMNLVNAGAPIGNVVVMCASGVIADYLGWEAIFYIFGGFAVLWFFLWQFLIYDNPQANPKVSQYELALIEKREGASVGKDNHKRPVPWKHILTCVPVWAMVAAHFGQNWGNYTLQTNLPMYMKNILRFNLSQNGVYSALPHLALWIFSIASGYMADFLRSRRMMSTTNVRKLCNTIGNVFPAIALVSVAYAGCEHALAVALLVLATGISGFTQSSYIVNSIDLTPTFAAVVYGFSNTIANVPGIVSPYVVGVIVQGPHGQSLSNWRTIFYISGGIRLIATVFYLCFASSEVQSWEYESEEPVARQ